VNHRTLLRYALKTPEEYARDTNSAVPVTKRYFKHSSIPDIVASYPMPRRRAAAGSGATKDAARDVSNYNNHLNFRLTTVRCCCHDWDRK
jgi:hypothetical protein